MSETPPPADPAAEAAEAERKKAQRRTWFTRLGLAVAVVAVIWLLYWLLIGSHRVTTDDAYVQADVAQVTALVNGAVISVPVRDTQQVAKGQVLAQIEPADYRLAVERAKAELAQAERRVRGYQASEQAAAAQSSARRSDIAASQAQLASAEAELSRAQLELRRRSRLAPSGAVSGEEVTQAQTRVQTAQAAVRTARAGLAQARANAAAAGEQRRVAATLVEGVDLAANPEVVLARAKLAQAQLDLSRTVIRAPVSGLVARKSIEIGQRVSAGAQLMTVVPVQSAYVDANFKEVQLKKIRIGSPVTLTSDLYGGRVKFHGKVVGIAGGSGAAFALIPAQNATGNWVKVVQRVPVRIALDPAELQRHPLRVGLSMKAVVKAS